MCSVAALCGFLFAIIPEELFAMEICFYFSEKINIFLARFGLFAILLFLYYCYKNNRNSALIEGYDYKITVEYGNLFKVENCKKVIPFDECFTTTVGDRPFDINKTSICGQYLLKNSISQRDMYELIKESGLKPLRSRSSCQNKIRYESGSLVPRDNDLLLAFSKLDSKGLGVLSKHEYIDSLFRLWSEIDTYYKGIDICVPVLGSGVTRIGDKKLTQQELLDIMIATYKLSTYKIKKPQKLRIICRKKDNFSIGNIGETV